MAKFNAQAAAARPVGAQAPLRTTGEVGATHEGGTGYVTDTKTELFRLAATNMVGEDTFYEGASERDNRFRDLVRAVTATDPEWIQRFIPFLRNEMFMRSASIVVAAEYAAAGGPNPRGVIASACSRADEPGEFIAYWQLHYGARGDDVYPKRAPRLSGGVKRGVADAAIKLYNEFSALKYDGISNAIRPGDVIELAHPSPKDDHQAAVFRYLLDRRHRGGDARVDDLLEKLPIIAKARQIDGLDRDELHRMLVENPQVLDDSGYTWERLSGKTEMDAKAWEAIIPQMGPFAILRNLRNFDQTEISKEAREIAKAKIADPAQIAKAKLFPFRFWSAYRAAPSLSWGEALEEGLSHATANIPELPGKTLVLIDYSGSMHTTLNPRSSVARWQVGALFGAAQFHRSRNADLIAFGNNGYRIPIERAHDVLRAMDICSGVYEANGSPYARSGNASQFPGAEHIGHGTQTMETIQASYDNHDRIVVFSDMQCFAADNYSYYYDRSQTSAKQFVDDLDVPIYSFDLGGYKMTHLPAGDDKRYLLAGFSDACFSMIPMLEAGSHVGWPF